MSLGDAPSRTGPEDPPEPPWCSVCQEQHDEPCEIDECEWCGEKHTPHCDEAEPLTCCANMKGAGHTAQCNDEARGDYLYDRWKDEGF